MRHIFLPMMSISISSMTHIPYRVIGMYVCISVYNIASAILDAAPGGSAARRRPDPVGAVDEEHGLLKT